MENAENVHSESSDSSNLLIDELDIEHFEGDGRKPDARKYRFRVDRQVLVSDRAELSGADILSMAGKVPPSGYLLWQIFRGGHSEPVELNAKVDLRTAGVEKFRTLPRDQTEG